MSRNTKEMIVLAADALGGQNSHLDTWATEFLGCLMIRLNADRNARTLPKLDEATFSVWYDEAAQDVKIP